MKLHIAAVLVLIAVVGCKGEETSEAPATPPTQTNQQPKSEKAKEADKVQAQATKDGELGPGTKEQQDIMLTAKTFFLQDNWDAAAVEFEKLTKTGPVSGPQVTAYIALGQIYQDQSKPEKALHLYEELLKKAPEVAEVQFVVGRAYAEQGETTKAIKAYELTIKYQPNYLQAYTEVASLYAKAGRNEESAKMFLDYEQRVYRLAGQLEKAETTPQEALEILEVFSFIQDDRANQAILKSLDSPHAAVRERAVVLTMEFKLGAATEKIQRMANDDPDLRVRMMAKEALKSTTGAPVDGSSPTFVDDKSKLPKE